MTFTCVCVGERRGLRDVDLLLDENVNITTAIKEKQKYRKKGRKIHQL